MCLFQKTELENVSSDLSQMLFSVIAKQNSKQFNQRKIWSGYGGYDCFSVW